VFKLTPSGTLTTLHSFCSASSRSCADGVAPEAGVIEGSDGNFYGTTFSGGVSSVGGGQPAGTVFRLTPSGTLTTLYSFCGEVDPINPTNCLDGSGPNSIVEGSDGNFYGTTVNGGVNGVQGNGTLLKLGVSSQALAWPGLTISPGRRSFGNTPVGTTRHKTFLLRRNWA